MMKSISRFPLWVRSASQISRNRAPNTGCAHNYKLIVKEQKVEVKSESVIGDWVGDDNAGDAEEVNK